MSEAVCRWGTCDQSFASPEELGSHIDSTHVGKSQSSYNCMWDGCDNEKAHSNRFVLMSHIRKHTGEKPFKCTTCGRGFSRNDALNKHLKSHDNNEVVQETVPAALIIDSEEIRYSLLKERNEVLQLSLNSTEAKIRRLRAEKILILDKLLEDTQLRASII